MVFAMVCIAGSTVPRFRDVPRVFDQFQISLVPTLNPNNTSTTASAGIPEALGACATHTGFVARFFFLTSQFGMRPAFTAGTISGKDLFFYWPHFLKCLLATHLDIPTLNRKFLAPIRLFTFLLTPNSVCGLPLQCPLAGFSSDQTSLCSGRPPRWIVLPTFGSICKEFTGH
jgi:hypothetical protein